MKYACITFNVVMVHVFPQVIKELFLLSPGALRRNRKPALLRAVAAIYKWNIGKSYVSSLPINSYVIVPGSDENARIVSY